MEKLNNADIIGDLVRLRSAENFNPTNPHHAKIITRALFALNYCGDTMALALEAMGERSKASHNETYDKLSPHPSHT